MKNDDFKVSVIIASYNGQEALKKGLPEVISAKDVEKNKILEIVVVDDASTDDSAKVVKAEFPQVRLIRHVITRGFSACVNTGARSARGKLLAFLQTGAVPEKDYLVSALRHFSSDEVFAVSLREKGRHSWTRGSFQNGYVEYEPTGRTDKPHATFWVSLGNSIVRRDYWMELGGVDEKIFTSEWADVDLCYRAAKRGFRLVWEPRGSVWRDYEVSSWSAKRNADTLKRQDELLFVWKNVTSQSLTKRHIAELARRLARHPSYVPTVFKALIGLRAVLKAREKEKKESKVSDEAIFSNFQNP